MRCPAAYGSMLSTRRCWPKPGKLTKTSCPAFSRFLVSSSVRRSSDRSTASYRGRLYWWMCSTQQTLGQELEISAAAICDRRSEEQTSELQSLMRISYAVFCLKKKIQLRKTTKQYNNSTASY